MYIPLTIYIYSPKQLCPAVEVYKDNNTGRDGYAGYILALLMNITMTCSLIVISGLFAYDNIVVLALY